MITIPIFALLCCAIGFFLLGSGMSSMRWAKKFRELADDYKILSERTKLQGRRIHSMDLKMRDYE